jgi:hypothetical protein
MRRLISMRRRCANKLSRAGVDFKFCRVVLIDCTELDRRPQLRDNASSPCQNLEFGIVLAFYFQFAVSRVDSLNVVPVQENPGDLLGELGLTAIDQPLNHRFQGFLVE